MKNLLIFIIIVVVITVGCKRKSEGPTPEQQKKACEQYGRALLQEVKDAIDSGRDLNKALPGDVCKYTLLHECARSDAAEAARLLLENGADINVGDWLNATPLHRAVLINHVSVAQLLLDKGANIEARDNSGATPMFYAVMGSENLESVALLVEHGAKINVNSDGPTLLSFATYPGNYKIVKYLLDHGADVSAERDGYTALHMAGSMGCAKIAEMLVRYGADVNAVDRNGETPLYHAMHRQGNHTPDKKQKEVVAMLRKLGAVELPTPESEAVPRLNR